MLQPGYYPTGFDSPGSEPTGKAFFGSLLTHGVVIGLITASGLFHFSKNNFGSPHASSGSVGVNMVKTIPIARREGPVNPVANDTKSIVPQAPAPEKVQKLVKAPPEKAIPIPDK